MNLEEYRKKKAENNTRAFIKFTDEGEVHYLRFLNPVPSAEAHLKTFDQDKKKYLYDENIPENYSGKISVVLRLSVIEYDQGGANPKKSVWEFSEYLYNKFAKNYIEDPDAGQVIDNVWKVKAASPKTLDCSYTFIKVNSTPETYPILKAVEEVKETPSTEQPKEVKAAPRKTGYFD